MKAATARNGEALAVMLKDMVEIDTIYIQSESLDSINKNLSYLHFDVHSNLSKVEGRFLGATYDTVFTVLVTLLIFIAGIIIDRIIKRRQGRTDQKDLKEYFFNQIEEIVDGVGPGLIGGYKKYYQSEIGINQGIPATPPKVLTNNFERLLGIDSAKLYIAFSKSDRSKFNEYLSRIDFLANLIREIDSFHSLVLKRSEFTRNEISPLHLEFYNKLVEFNLSIEAENADYINDEHHKFVLDKLILFKNEIAGKRALKEFHDKIVVPTLKYIKSENLNVDHPIGAQIYSTGKLFMTKYHDLKYLVTEVRLQYREFYNKLDNSIQKITTLYKS